MNFCIFQTKTKVTFRLSVVHAPFKPQQGPPFNNSLRQHQQQLAVIRIKPQRERRYHRRPHSDHKLMRIFRNHGSANKNVQIT